MKAKEAIRTIGVDNNRIARDIIAMDDEVDRFSFYIVRLLKVAVSDTFVLRENGLKSQRECLGYRLITKSVVRTADHAVNVSTNSLTLTLANLSEEVIGELRALSDTAISVFEDAIESLFKEDYSIADNVLKGAENTRGKESEIVQKIIKSAQPEDIPALRLLIESIIRTAEYGADIVEVVLNMTIRDEIREG